MEPEFPILDIPVGIYYKILTENHGRVTRQKTAALTEKRKESQSSSMEDIKKNVPKQTRAPRQKKLKELELSKKRAHPEESKDPPKRKLKKLRDESKELKVKEGPKRKETKKDSAEPLKRYTQNISGGFFRENVIGRIAYLVRKTTAGVLQTRYIKFTAPTSPKSESYYAEEVDPQNFRKIKDKTVKETISLKQDKVYLVLEPAWLCLSFKEPRYQPVLVLLNIGRIDIADLQLPDQPFPTDAKPQGENTSKPSIFGKDQPALIMDLKAQVLHKCNTELLFRYNPSLDSTVRQDYMKRVSANLKFYSDLDYLFELNQKWLKENEEVELTTRNVGSCLFSEVRFEEKRGVLLYYEKDKKALCIRVYSGGSEEPEIEWVYLTGSNVPKISVNMLKGKVSLPDLEKVDPTVALKNYKPQYKHCEIQEDEDPSGKIDEQEIKLKRCKKCNYVIDDLAYLECRKCEEFFHQQCLTAETMKKGLRDLQWRCADCVRCCLCLSSKGRDCLMLCTVCNTGYHTKCMEPAYANQIPSSAKGRVQWKCEHCVKCISCGTKSAGPSKQSKWSNDYTLCSKCRKKKINNQYCPVCELIWSSTDEEPMIQCSCGMWVHQSCDKTLTDNVFDSYKQNGRKYLCIKCRKEKRSIFVKQVVEALASEDKSHFFLNPVDVTVVPKYEEIIKNPMCFKTMQEKAAQGVYLADIDALKNDFELICTNAKHFNKPKTVYHRDADNLLNYGGDILKINWATLQKFQAMTKEEEEYAKKVIERKKSNKALSPSLAPSKPKKIEEDKKKSEEESKIDKKTLRRRRLINYNEDQAKNVDSSNAFNPLIITDPKIPIRRRKIIASNKKEPMSQIREKPEVRVKSDPNAVQRMFEQLAQKDEKESKYLYSNPVIVQFNDPMLCFSEMCSLCGAFGNQEDFVMCILCGESYHPYCITLPTGVSLDKIRRYWKCLNCKYCEHCCKATNEDKLLYCDSCDKAYHTFCSTPPLKVVPNCGWRCKDCFKCAKCGTQSFFHSYGNESAAARSIVDYSHTNNFTYCYKCGSEEHNKSLCSICKQKSASEENPLKCCGTCKKWSHVRCSRMTLKEFGKLRERRVEFKCFTCLMRERSSQEIHYEVCEAYLNINNILYRHSMLSDLLHVVLKKYLAPLEEDHANSLLAAYVESNEEFFRTDPDINEAHVVYEEGSSTITSPSIIADNEQMERPKAYEREMKDLLKITKESMRREKIEMPMNDQVMQDVLNEESDAEFEKMKDIMQDQRVVGLCLSQQAKEALRIQQLKQMYKELGITLKPTKDFDKYQTTSIVEVYENDEEFKETPYPTIIAQSIQASESLRMLENNREPIERMSDIEEVKGKPRAELRIPFRSEERFVPKGINDTFLPKRWNIYDSLYKGHPRYRQGRQFDEYIDLIGNNQEVTNIRERQMRVEIATVVKVQENFHHWIFNYLNTKVQELKKSLHNKSGFDRSFGKIGDEASKGNPSKQLEGASLMDIIEDLDPIIENPSRNLVCCLCKQRGERKMSGRLIPFQGLLSVHVNCAFWSSEVFETTEGALINFFFAYKRAKAIKCNYCGKTGASLGCSSKKCHVNYHFICALSQQAAFLPSKVLYCRQCAKNKGHPHGLCSELSQKRRFYIAKNNTPFANSNDMADGTVERWKPFGYESFNRVGNLTVIRLSRRLDEILAGNYREVPLLGSLDGYMSLRITWNIFDLNKLSAGLPFFASKGYYLCRGSNTKSMMVRAYARPSVNIIRPHLPQCMVLAPTEADERETKVIAEKDAREIQSLWLGGIKKHLPNFSLENISLSPEDFVGITKFPISAWHMLNVKNAEVVLYSCAQTESVKPVTGASKRDTNASKQTHPMFIGRLKEETFDDIINLNCEIGRKSTKYISYKRSQPSPFVGKIGVRDIGAPPASKFSRKGKLKEAPIESKNPKTNVREVDLPIGMKYRNYRQMVKAVEVAPSRIHKNGLFATEDFSTGDIVIEYVGELIRDKVADKREKIYMERGFGDCYMFRLDKDVIIDATVYGSKARYLNHCCFPNCSAKINVIHGTKHIIIFANRYIKKGEELTYDYQFDVEAEKIACNCGAPNCQGRLN